MDVVRAVCLAGPTGTGKTRAALALADRFGGGVVNFDSRQMYRDFPVITAQPTPEERAACPHHLYGFLDCVEKMTAGRYSRLGAATVRRMAGEGLLPILVGGTGLYLRSLLGGIAPIPEIPGHIHLKWIEACEARGPEDLHALLAEQDPDYAARIHPRDRQRVTRALEVREATGRPLSWWHDREHASDAPRAMVICLDTAVSELAPRLEARIAAMLEAGALDEARRALEQCPDTTAPGWSSIGCAELAAHLKGETTLDEAVELWLRNTKAYAKRQMTWFRKEKAARWVDSGDVEAMAALVRRFLDDPGDRP